jgi:GntR family transcriptional repressor for pyruvate dehydrogenase complex
MAAAATSGEQRTDSVAIRDRKRGTRAHLKLVELIEAGDGPGAEQFWRSHMEIAGQVLLRNVGSKMIVDLMGD